MVLSRIKKLILETEMKKDSRLWFAPIKVVIVSDNKIVHLKSEIDSIHQFKSATEIAYQVKRGHAV